MSPSSPPDRPVRRQRPWPGPGGFGPGGPGPWLAAAAAGSALVAATWLVAMLSLRQQMAAMQGEIDLCRSSRGINLPVLLKDLNRFAAAAASRQEAERLQQRLLGLEADQGRTLTELARSKAETAPAERFHLASGSDYNLLAGQITVAVAAVRTDGADVALAGAAASPWKTGEFRDLSFGDGPYRLRLEATRSEPPRATFHLEALKAAAATPASSGPTSSGPSTPAPPAPASPAP